MPKKKTRKVGSRSPETREAILSAARDEFGTRGFIGAARLPSACAVLETAGVDLSACFVDGVSGGISGDHGHVGVAGYVGAAANNYVVEDFQVQYVDPPAPVNTAANRYPNNNGVVSAANSSTLYWYAGDGAVSHDVYFGTSESAVTNASSDLPR